MDPAEPDPSMCPICGSPQKLHQDVAAFIRAYMPRALAPPATRGKAMGRGGSETRPQEPPMKPETPTSPAVEIVIEDGLPLTRLADGRMHRSSLGELVAEIERLRTTQTSYAVHTCDRRDGATWMDSGARCRTEAEALAHGRALVEGTDRRWSAVPSTDAPHSPAHLDLRIASERARVVLDTLYFEYQRKIGPFASQAHDAAMKLSNALKQP